MSALDGGRPATGPRSRGDFEILILEADEILLGDPLRQERSTYRRIEIPIPPSVRLRAALRACGAPVPRPERVLADLLEASPLLAGALSSLRERGSGSARDDLIWVEVGLPAALGAGPSVGWHVRLHPRPTVVVAPERHLRRRAASRALRAAPLILALTFPPAVLVTACFSTDARPWTIALSGAEAAADQALIGAVGMGEAPPLLRVILLEGLDPEKRGPLQHRPLGDVVSAAKAVLDPATDGSPALAQWLLIDLVMDGPYSEEEIAAFLRFFTDPAYRCRVLLVDIVPGVSRSDRDGRLPGAIVDAALDMGCEYMPSYPPGASGDCSGSEGRPVARDGPPLAPAGVRKPTGERLFQRSYATYPELLRHSPLRANERWSEDLTVEETLLERYGRCYLPAPGLALSAALCSGYRRGDAGVLRALAGSQPSCGGDVARWRSPILHLNPDLSCHTVGRERPIRLDGQEPDEVRRLMAEGQPGGCGPLEPLPLAILASVPDVELALDPTGQLPLVGETGQVSRAMLYAGQLYGLLYHGQRGGLADLNSIASGREVRGATSVLLSALFPWLSMTAGALIVVALGVGPRAYLWLFVWLMLLLIAAALSWLWLGALLPLLPTAVLLSAATLLLVALPRLRVRLINGRSLWSRWIQGSAARRMRDLHEP